MTHIINENKIHTLLANSKACNSTYVREILIKARELHGLTLEETVELINVNDQELLEELFTTAAHIKEKIYGRRIVLFAPLYISNLCNNECLYCAFRATNKQLVRKFLSQDAIKNETMHLINEGHKRILLVAGEAYPDNNFQYILKAIAAIYSVKNRHGEIRRINVNLAPQEIAEFKHLKDAGIGTYQLFQETYHRDTYSKVHISGKKMNYDWRISAFDRALVAGIDDVGFGVLFGLYDWRFEVLALIEHAGYLEEHFGIGPHTISVPRIEPALGSALASKPLAPVNDADFCKLVAILRLAIPYTGIIMSTREGFTMRQKTLALGVSQISAGSRTDPGGYGDAGSTHANQFILGDIRTTDEVVRDLATLGYLPSFCTACYRLGRTGEDFIHLAKHGKIKKMCTPNATATFAEYLHDYATRETQEIGYQLIQNKLNNMSQPERQLTEKLLAQVSIGKRDVFI